MATVWQRFVGFSEMSRRQLDLRFPLLLLALLLGGCEDSPSLLPIDSVIELRLSEDTGRLLIRQQTQQQYSCLGYQIVHKDFTESGYVRPVFRIDLLGIQPPAGPCAAMPGPATATSSLALPTIGTHKIQITVNNTVVTAMLEVTSDSLFVTGGVSPWTLWPEPRVARP
jgi:hypothetical protein